MKTQGYCKVAGDKVLLGFIEAAPCFAGIDTPVLELIEANVDQCVVGYSVITGDDNHGFLYPLDRKSSAECLAKNLTNATKQQYRVIGLSIKIK